mmetsp:Transcript_94426/g.238083  ORF Transcript_94426/g.238083 Transcript_94426/m.238083 type:complete len:212 (+) Transcript_94426:1205-1840(+)
MEDEDVRQVENLQREPHEVEGHEDEAKEDPGDALPRVGVDEESPRRVPRAAGDPVLRGHVHHDLLVAARPSMALLVVDQLVEGPAHDVLVHHHPLDVVCVELWVVLHGGLQGQGLRGVRAARDGAAVDVKPALPDHVLLPVLHHVDGDLPPTHANDVRVVPAVRFLRVRVVELFSVVGRCAVPAHRGRARQRLCCLQALIFVVMLFGVTIP